MLPLPLEKQLASLEWSRKLKEIGEKQESIWWWQYPIKDEDMEGWGNILSNKRAETIAGASYCRLVYTDCSAYTCAELMARLPQVILVSKDKLLSMEDVQGELYIKKILGGSNPEWYEWLVGYCNKVYERKTEERIVPTMVDKNPSNALAAMLYHLRKEKIV